MNRIIMYMFNTILNEKICQIRTIYKADYHIKIWIFVHIYICLKRYINMFKTKLMEIFSWSWEYTCISYNNCIILLNELWSSVTHCRWDISFQSCLIRELSINRLVRVSYDFYDLPPRVVFIIRSIPKVYQTLSILSNY